MGYGGHQGQLGRVGKEGCLEDGGSGFGMVGIPVSWVMWVKGVQWAVGRDLETGCGRWASL